MSYEIRQKIEGHKKIVCVNLEEIILSNRRYKLFNRHLVRNSDADEFRKEWFETNGLIGIKQVYNLAQNLRNSKKGFCIWYENYSYEDLEKFEEEMKDKKEEYFPAEPERIYG